MSEVVEAGRIHKPQCVDSAACGGCRVGIWIKEALENGTFDQRPAVKKPLTRELREVSKRLC